MNNKKNKVYDLKKLLDEELNNKSNDLVTRQTGQTIRERIERELGTETDGQIVTFDFSKVGITSSSEKSCSTYQSRNLNLYSLNFSLSSQ